jgi:hypothetical protein
MKACSDGPERKKETKFHPMELQNARPVGVLAAKWAVPRPPQSYAVLTFPHRLNSFPKSRVVPLSRVNIGDVLVVTIQRG